jgi:DNA-binding Lrp family transcriptional regulator
MGRALVLVNASPGRDRAVARRLKQVRGVSGVCLVSGLYDVVGTVTARSQEEIINLIYDRVRTIPGVTGSHTMFCVDV